MNIFLCDLHKMTRMRLPDNPGGIFTMNYKDGKTVIKNAINIEAKEGVWYIISNDVVKILENDIPVHKAALKPHCYYKLQILSIQKIVLLYCAPTPEDYAFKLMPTAGNISISNTNADITYSNELLAGTMINITKEGEYWYIALTAGAGLLFVNNIRANKMRLKHGDLIFVYGLKIMFMKDFLYVNNPLGKVTVSTTTFRPYQEQGNIDNSQFADLPEVPFERELYDAEDFFFHRPRIKESVVEKTVRIDPPPQSQLQEELPFVFVIGSSITMIISSFVSGFNVFNSISQGKDMTSLIPQMLMCISLLVGSLIVPRALRAYQGKRMKQKEAFRQEKYSNYLKKKEDEIKGILTQQAQVIKTNYFSLDKCYNTVQSQNISALWSRESSDEDFLSISVGNGNMRPKIIIEAPEEQFVLEEDNLLSDAIALAKKEFLLENVPVSFSFLENRIASAICNTQHEESYINGLILQLVTHHSAADVKLIFLLNNDNNIDKQRWNYAKFLPHCLSEDKSVRYFAETPSEIKTVLTFVEEEFNSRRDKVYGARKEEDDSSAASNIDKIAPYKSFPQYYIIITNDYLAIKNHSMIDKMLGLKVNLGFSLFILENSMQKIPNECTAFLQIADKEGWVIKKNLNDQTKFMEEHDSSIDMKEVATKLSNIPIHTKDIAASLPSSLTFLEMFNVSRIEHLNILNRWKDNNPTQSLQANIGVRASGEEMFLDLHEKFHGPHGLIAGSTGSGKSEFIITYILSMALNYHPDEVQFVLIDYKGGGLAGAFENRQTGVVLPHLAGTITNLDTNEMNRTLVSINSELKRRQKLFNDFRDSIGESTIDIYKYQKYYREGVAKEPMAHLFIVSDEFAELKAQQPEFMDELISTARIGRSLGVHLILATQKPTGVVNDQIWSNSKFKICLKVQNRSDSMEMLKKPDAASIKEAGRFYLQVGYDELFELGQSGWSGAKYIPSDRIIKKIDDSINFIGNTGFVYKSINDIAKVDTSVNFGDQLTNVVKYIIETAKKVDHTRKTLWLDKVPEQIYINELIKKYKYVSKPYVIEALIGEYDNPKEQMQGLLQFDLTKNGNSLIYGMPGSGKENLLSTMIYTICAHHKPEEVNIYIMDFGAETLKKFDRFPQVSDTCLLGDDEKILDLMVLLDKEVDRRKELFSEYGGSYIDYIKQSGEKLPLIVTFINNYEVFCESYGNYSELLSTLYRDAHKYGIVFVVACSASNTIRSRVAELFGNKLCLQMANDQEYRNLLDAPRKLQPAKCFGRGIVQMDSTGYEFQTAIIKPTEQLNEYIKLVVEKLKNAFGDVKMNRIPVVPDKVSIDFCSDALLDLAYIPVGVEMASKEVYTYNFINQKLNIISAMDLHPHISFVNALLLQFKKLGNIDVKVIDALNIIDAKKIIVDIFSESLDDAIQILHKEIEQNIKKVFVFVGVGKLKSKLSEKGAKSFDDLFYKLNNRNDTTFIFIDSYESMKNIQFEPWYVGLVDNKRGIWLGQEVGTQMLLTYHNVDSDTRKIDFDCMSFVNKDGQAVLIKYIVDEEGETNEK